MMTTKNILITGGAGFIGSHVIKRFVHNYPNYNIVNLDKLTYAGNLKNLISVENEKNYFFEKADIQDEQAVVSIFEKHKINAVIHLAAESHVDRSILDPLEFVKTNVLGTANLLNAAKNAWKDGMENKLFYHVSTDEVFGSLGNEGFFTEDTAYDPRSPYSASKAGSDHLAIAYYHTFKLPVVLSNCSNNYGSFQFPEKLIPLMINNIIHFKPLPIYGKGDNIRDWLWVDDHAKAIDIIFHSKKIGEKYNIGGINEWKNIDLVQYLCALLDKKLNRSAGTSAKLISYVKDRKGHDQRYAIDASKINKELGWQPSVTFEQGLKNTVDWYLENSAWTNEILSGTYQHYYEKNYKNR